MEARNPAPSRAVTAGTVAGGPLAPLIVWGLTALGVPVTPELAACVGTLITAALAYIVRGGRKGEAD